MTTVHTQPQSTHTTIVMQQQPSVDSSKRPWRSGICGCFDECGSCMIVCVLSALGLAECYGCVLSSRMNESSCLCGCVPGYLTALRTKLRTEEDIQGSICDDCIMTTFCRPCVMCQMARELDHCN